jgi:large subunit ribosomal protein L6
MPVEKLSPGYGKTSMSRIGKLPVKIPEGVTVKVVGNTIEVGGVKGVLTLKLHTEAKVEVSNGEIKVKMLSENLSNIHGVTRSLLANMVKGVSEGWAKTVELSGTGYKAASNGSELQLSLGFSHPVIVKALPGITFEVKENQITIRGADKIMVGETAARIRGLKPADPYKAKGFKYEGETIIHKVGKAATKVAA